MVKVIFVSVFRQFFQKRIKTRNVDSFCLFILSNDCLMSEGVKFLQNRNFGANDHPGVRF